ncbi:unnamed protein product [Plasmodium vivax]|uniref:RNA binding protein, putative n=5 Tax=Plasmodium vivax TaxID=5855 RepID=A5K3L9_PLAVS|nr:RNA binding protein, putative [Plasmodium vivax]KMZ85206.1 RNA binding protein [Plasmodium vivax Brazil I]KMZ91667.1 RNA binding protein [Plasmodium vivax Mauritania I]KMZ97879.1 RNA binding protein [Plasmodium vivax North Korean]EDL46123.1 RNA binding protein, putative [Plasmodium vivax]CAG9473800.1 unnamed protein product [Plasmodium vivax]|eukprot:XP_001615850.1 RNA binding protein [Plasmodium vivax Sal-1]
MDSLYGDLPPPVSNSSNKIGNNNDKNSSSEAKKNDYIEINKFLITPAIIQKKIANIKNVNKEMDSDQNDRKDDEAEKYSKHNHINAGEDSCDSDIYIDRDVGRNEERATSHKGKNTPNGEKTREKNDTHIEKIININKSVQDDLRKISDRLHKIQRSNNRPEQNISTNHLNGQVISAKVEKIKNIEVNIKKGKLQDHSSGGNRNSAGAGEVTSPPTEYFQAELYEKYFIANANEDYDPNRPNDLNKIIKERKRKKIIMLAAQKKKLEEERQMEETNKMDGKNGRKEYDRKNNYYRYDQPNGATAVGKFPFESDHNSNSYTNSGMPPLHDEEKERNRGSLYNHFDISGRNFTARGEYNPRERSEWDTPYDDKEYGKEKKTSEKFYENVNRTKLSDPSNDDYKKKNKEVPNDTSEEVAAPVKKDFATRMMEKMGWKKGEGLGKDKQGITAPLILQKVDKRSGVIVQAPDILKKHKSGDGQEDNNDDGNSFSKSNANLAHSNHALSNSTSRIIRLSNLVTKDEVDDTLKEEIEEEASKFGNLLNINIAIDKNLTDAHAVKIFCEYESNDQAQNALNTFKGRTFAGRKVEAIFATEEEYLSHGKAP